ncbi:BadF/BadG/BcrA/BcrD ATPase family protein [Edaphobacillus lindanitolerans]|uniref:BadF-type ATPase n=1 Tax=Edaphobacillus lindanitolerans TaxID=550447 RepID=A0A1U7PKW5_9BACI|nr:BadF/BadG/BcrA/BcrD ATPase family protein [Edaphobacillus lindanitolerans]SIT72248.1 BadF-type ATPase [Edaphobacillus lindanitolerans]
MTILAIDGGGTKTAAVLCELDGRVLARLEAGPSNPTVMQPGEFVLALSEVFERLRSMEPEAFGRLAFVQAGMSGVTENGNERLVKEAADRFLPAGCRLSVSNDSVNALMAGTLGTPGIVQVAGTGAITYSLDEEGRAHRVAGWGYLFDDEGSGYDLGNQALRCVFRAYDGRGRETALTGAVLNHFGVPAVPDLIPLLYGSGGMHPRSLVAPLGRYVVELARTDEAAGSIVRRASEGFYECVVSCFRKSAFAGSDVPVVLAGGVFSDFELFFGELERLRSGSGHEFRFVRPKMPPVGGAAIAPLKLDLSEAEAFAEKFNGSY